MVIEGYRHRQRGGAIPIHDIGAGAVVEEILQAFDAVAQCCDVEGCELLLTTGFDRGTFSLLALELSRVYRPIESRPL